ncbi:uncharacterized protein LOC128951937 [Oppia nitens]|uniref:uncharacterized protein LOC128951937 n=1 Tax=Oppia nitens TaxID=1686743 RepID=UPI0023D9945A|nr:uncharacterized protein LOC128951937 [Oppia nitens]
MPKRNRTGPVPERKFKYGGGRWMPTPDEMIEPEPDFEDENDISLKLSESIDMSYSQPKSASKFTNPEYLINSSVNGINFVKTGRAYVFEKSWDAYIKIEIQSPPKINLDGIVVKLYNRIGSFE